MSGASNDKKEGAEPHVQFASPIMSDQKRVKKAEWAVEVSADGAWQQFTCIKAGEFENRGVLVGEVTYSKREEGQQDPVPASISFTPASKS